MPTPLPTTQVGLHALWRPGVGLAVWTTSSPDPGSEPDPRPESESGRVTGPGPEPGPDEIPEPLRSLLSGKRFRRQVGVIDADGRRRFVATLTLGTASAVSFLDATRSVAVPGDIVWYRHLLDGVRRFVVSGSVVPTLAEVAGETVMRWQPATTSAWRAWSAVITGGAPAALTENGGAAALMDFAVELTDHECRARIAASPAALGPIGVTAPLLRALVADATVPAEATAPAAIAAWAAWAASVPAADSALVFRLHEPDDPDAPDARFDDDDDFISAARPSVPVDPEVLRWRLQVCRRAVDGHVEPVAPQRLDAEALDEITTDLASAVRAFPDLARADPDRATLDFLLPTPMAETLFATGASALADAGFPVLLPRTIAEVRPTLGVRARPVPGGGAPARMVGLREIREFEWRLALGDGPDALTLGEADLDELSRQKGDLVRIRGVWVRAEGAALTRAASFVTAQRALSGNGHEVDMGELFGMITHDSEKPPVPVTSVQGLTWLDEIAESGALRPVPIPRPHLLHASLRPYQQRGLEWLAHLSGLGIGGVLADDMGLGKTVQVIALLCHEAGPDDGPVDTSDPRSAPPSRPDGLAPHRPTLIVCPMSVVGNWAAEIARFAPSLRVAVHHGADRAKGERFREVHHAHDVVLTTFALVTRDRDALAAQAWHRVVVDEAQHVKNVRTAAARALRAIPADHRIALTGTPVENRLEDLRAVIDLVNPGLLGSASTFRNRFAEPIERDRDPATIRRLAGLTRPFILRREKSDPSIISDLPEKNEITVRANLTVEQAALYRAVIDDLMEALRDRQQRALRRRTVLAALTRLKQICNHPAHYLADGTPVTRRGRHRSGKLELLEDIVTTLVAEGDQALIFTQFAAFGELLSGWLTELLDTEVPLLHGGVSRADRDALVQRFQHGTGGARPPVLLATLKAGGTGLNLTAANHVVHVDRWWNPAVEDQATDRAYRIGQKQRVHVRRFVCVGTLEERVDDLIAKKRELSRLTVSTGENWMGDLGDEELFDLFRLREEAVSE
ncbi:SNF2-related protein [Gordonia sp. NB41Y]|uniref:SNF2-related protein n=1 Tax=Gordonia sp. NB41Y TaxID=875808 RepID=UPI00128EAE24|nr:SNF2-related protein [Gordonia sp. NB41Y]WLP90060.1 SNF2-related protein [Gordonia sp. NB41Y]